MIGLRRGMTNQEILEKAIQKAIAGGWDWSKIWTGQDYILEYLIESPQTYIFNHDFAKSLWGKQETKPGIGKDYSGATGGYGQRITNHGWQYHLQQMVVADDPIKYLGENI